MNKFVICIAKDWHQYLSVGKVYPVIFISGDNQFGYDLMNDNGERFKYERRLFKEIKNTKLTRLLYD